jgi:hypothetical protein
MLTDAEYFNSHISRLEGAGDLGPHIVEIVKNKTIIADSQRSPSTSTENVDPGTRKDIENTLEANEEREKT